MHTAELLLGVHKGPTEWGLQASLDESLFLFWGKIIFSIGSNLEF